MADEVVEKAPRHAKLGIYDRLREVLPVSSPRAHRAALSSRTRSGGVHTEEKAAETAARRMVEDHFKQENDRNDSTNPMADFVLIETNEFPYRGKQEESEGTATCDCVYQEGDPASCCGEQCLNILAKSECRRVCPCGEHCKNQRFQRNQYAKTKIFKTANKGWGLAADEDLKAGDFVIEYCGEVIPSRDAYLRAKDYEQTGFRDFYMIFLSAVEFIDATLKGSMGRFVNHSCEPNCEIQTWTVLGEERLGIFAIADISAGTELTYDYMKCQWYGGSSRIKCACEAKSCVGFLEASPKILQNRDAFAWEDDERCTPDAMQPRVDEDNASLSSSINRLGPKKSKIISSTKGQGTVPNLAATEKAVLVPSTPTAKESPSPLKDSTLTVKTESPTVMKDNGNPISAKRSKPSFGKKVSNAQIIATVLGKTRETPPETRSRKAVAKQTAKPSALEEEEIKLARKRAKVDAEAAHGRDWPPVVSAEQVQSENSTRLSAFQHARNSFNKRLAEESWNCFPISEAACTEVEFAQDLETAAVADLRSVCEDIYETLKESQNAGEEVPAAAAQKWTEAHCKTLRSSLDFHFSIVRHLAGPTMTLSQAGDDSSP